MGLFLLTPCTAAASFAEDVKCSANVAVPLVLPEGVLNDYLPVLSALIAVQRLERDIVVAKFDRLNYRVQLYRSLGGTWMGSELEMAREKPDG